MSSPDNKRFLWEYINPEARIHRKLNKVVGKHVAVNPQELLTRARGVRGTTIEASDDGTLIAFEREIKTPRDVLKYDAEITLPHFNEMDVYSDMHPTYLEYWMNKISFEQPVLYDSAQQLHISWNNDKRDVVSHITNINMFDQADSPIVNSVIFIRTFDRKYGNAFFAQVRLWSDYAEHVGAKDIGFVDGHVLALKESNEIIRPLSPGEQLLMGMRGTFTSKGLLHEFELTQGNLTFKLGLDRHVIKGYEQAFYDTEFNEPLIPAWATLKREVPFSRN